MTEAADTDNRNDDIFTRSMRAMPPGATVQEWLENTREGQFISIARDLSPAALDAWVEVAYLMVPAELHPDTALLNLCADFERARAARDAIPEKDEIDAAFNAAMDLCWSLSDQIEATRACTAVGRAAKAKAALAVIDDCVGMASEEAHIRVAIARLRDVAAGGLA